MHQEYEAACSKRQIINQNLYYEREIILYPDLCLGKKKNKSYLFWRFFLFAGAASFTLNLSPEVWEIIWGKKSHKPRPFLLNTQLMCRSFRLLIPKSELTAPSRENKKHCSTQFLCLAFYLFYAEGNHSLLDHIPEVAALSFRLSALSSPH